MAERCDVVIIGGGAAGLMCARVAGRRGRSVLILDHAKRPAEREFLVIRRGHWPAPGGGGGIER